MLLIKNNYLNNENNQFKANKVKEINYGLAILKSLLSFSVVISHCFSHNSTNNKIIQNIARNRAIHVPSFFIISFNFMCKNLLSKNIKLIFQRMKRLLIPYIVWPIVFWIINNLLHLKNKNIHPFNLKTLKIQLLWGHAYMTQFWFQWDLIVITIIFFLIVLLFNQYFMFILQTILIASYFFQYCNHNYISIIWNYPFYNRFTVGRMFEMIPFGVTGFILGYYQILNSLKKYKIKTFIFSIMIYNAITDYKIFASKFGLGYNGIALNIRSICVIFLFSLFPSNKIKNIYIINFLNKTTNYSAGIYYLHFSIHQYFSYYFQQMRKRTFLGVIINYIICYIVCALGNMIFGNTNLKYLFI